MVQFQCFGATESHPYFGLPTRASPSPNEFLPTVHGFDAFFGNLYHFNTEEETETDRRRRAKSVRAYPSVSRNRSCRFSPPEPRPVSRGVQERRVQRPRRTLQRP
ncbi:hypothetical protein E3N94_03595 [Cryobacterium sp. Sr3]|nr:hypothetical protein E3N94_03595 [Cryobacterium sp. Sr3]